MAGLPVCPPLGARWPLIRSCKGHSLLHVSVSVSVSVSLPLPPLWWRCLSIRAQRLVNLLGFWPRQHSLSPSPSLAPCPPPSFRLSPSVSLCLRLFSFPAPASLPPCLMTDGWEMLSPGPTAPCSCCLCPCTWVYGGLWSVVQGAPHPHAHPLTPRPPSPCCRCARRWGAVVDP